MVTGRQIRAARALINYRAEDLANEIGITTPALTKIETGHVVPRDSTVKRIIAAMSNNGVEFTEDGGVRPKAAGIEIFEGTERFDAFYDFLYEHLRANGGSVCLSIADETVISKYRSNSELHFKRMRELKEAEGFSSFRVLTSESNFETTFGYSEYRKAKAGRLAPSAFYTFGDCLALMSFAHDPSPYVVVLKNASFAAAYRAAFDFAWNAAEVPQQRGNE